MAPESNPVNPIKRFSELPDNGCFACGPGNPIGLKLRFRLAEPAGTVEPAGTGNPGKGVAARGAAQVAVEAEFVPRPEHQSFPGVMHGGLVTVLLDEAMGKCMVEAGIPAVTARMETRFTAPVRVGCPVRVSGRLVADRGRVLEAVAAIRDGEGKMLAEAKGTFVRVTLARLGLDRLVGAQPGAEG